MVAKGVLLCQQCGQLHPRLERDASAGVEPLWQDAISICIQVRCFDSLL